jgi:hypothetical protein
MKKTILSSVMIVLFAAAIVLIGCEQPITEVGVTYPSVEAPNVIVPQNAGYDAAKMSGVVYLHWEPVLNARGYQVWRKLDAEGEKFWKQSDLQPYEVSYADINSKVNPLQADKNYIYKVVALSPNSASDILDGVREVSVHTDAAQFGAVTLTAPTVTVSVDETLRRLEVKWEQNDAHYGVGYSLTFAGNRLPTINGR